MRGLPGQSAAPTAMGRMYSFGMRLGGCEKASAGGQTGTGVFRGWCSGWDAPWLRPCPICFTKGMQAAGGSSWRGMWGRGRASEIPHQYITRLGGVLRRCAGHAILGRDYRASITGYFTRVHLEPTWRCGDLGANHSRGPD